MFINIISSQRSIMRGSSKANLGYEAGAVMEVSGGDGKAIKFLCADNDDIFLGYDKPEKTMDTHNSVITNKLIKRQD